VASRGEVGEMSLIHVHIVHHGEVRWKANNNDDNNNDSDVNNGI
jgi:hypothetical protein